MIGFKWVFIIIFMPLVMSSQDFDITKLELNLPQEQPIVTNITLDAKKMLWFTANSTLFRFDGFRSVDVLKDFKLKDSQLFPDKILATSSNEIIFTSYHEVYTLDLVHWQLSNISPPFLKDKRNYHCNQFKQMADGSLVFLYESGEILRYHQGIWSYLSHLKEHAVAIGRGISANDVVEDKEYAWIATSEGGLLRIAKDDWNTAAMVQLFDTKALIKTLVPVTNGLWLEVEKEGIYYFDGAVLQAQQLPLDKDLFLDILVTVATDDHFVLMNKNKIVAVDKNDTKLVNEQGGIPWGLSNLTAAIAVDGELIVASTKGIYQLRPKRKVFEVLPFPKGRTSTRGIHVFKDGAIWLHSYGGALFISKEGRVKHFKDFDSGYAILPLSDKSLLLGTEGDFLKIFDKESETIRDIGIDAEEFEKLAKDGTYVISMAQDEYYFYLGTYNGLWKLHKKTKKLVRFMGANGEDPTLGLLIRHITVQDSLQIQLSTSQGYMGFINGQLKQSYPKYGKQGVYGHNIAGDIVWLATQGAGVVGIDWENGAVVQKIAMRNGLASDLVYDLLQVDDRLLALTDAGISVLEKDGGLIPFAGQTGFAKMEFNHGAQYYDAQSKKLYLGGVHGFAVLSEENLTSEPKSNTSLFISEMLLPNVGQSTLGHTYSLPYGQFGELEMSANEDMVSFNFGQSITAETKGQLFVELKGKKKIEQPISINQPYAMVGLAPGKYELKIKPNMNSDISLLDISLIKHPYFYRTWWFMILTVLGTTGIVMWWYRLKKGVRDRELEYRKQIAADLHDEVGSHLSALVLESQWIQASEKSVALRSFGKDVQRMSEEAMGGLREIISASNQKNQDWPQFINSLRILVLKEDIVKKIKVSFKVTGRVPNTMVPSTWNYHLSKIYKELIINALKHSNATELQVEIRFQKMLFSLAVADNGTGFESKKENDGYGIKNIHMRAGQLGAVCFFDTQQKGTNFWMNLKMEKIPPLRGGALFKGLF